MPPNNHAHEEWHRVVTRIADIQAEILILNHFLTKCRTENGDVHSSGGGSGSGVGDNAGNENIIGVIGTHHFRGQPRPLWRPYHHQYQYQFEHQLSHQLQQPPPPRIFSHRRWYSK